MRTQNLRQFSGEGYDKGRPVVVQLLWLIVSSAIFQAWWFPPACRPVILRLFGAQVGSRCIIRSRVRVHWPWKLALGDDCWIGEGAWLLNLENIIIGNSVCVSQEALLCTGSHDMLSESFEFKNSSIELQDRSWVGTRAVLLPGSRLGSASVVSAGVIYRLRQPAPSRLYLGDGVREIA